MRSIEDMVSAEVRCCVSYLIPELVKSDSSEWYDDLLSICRQDDYRTAAEDKGWLLMNRDGISVIVNGDQIYDPGNECVDDLSDVGDYVDYEVDDPDDCDVWRSLCDCEGIEPYETEALEHWVVTYWLAKKLEGYGEMVCHDLYGMTVWGRRTSGQAITADYVIQCIYQDTQRGIE